jgi:class 3 adenylate cyclase
MLARLFPSFPENLEAEFRLSHNRRGVRESRIGIIVGALIILGFNIWDRLVDPMHAGESLAVKLVIAGLLVSTSLLPFSILSKYMQTWLILVLSIAGLGVSANGMVLNDGLNRLLSGVMLVLMFNFAFGRLLFIPSLVSGSIICIGYNLSALFMDMPRINLIANDWFLFSALSGGGIVTYFVERLNRSRFLIEKDLSLERQRTEQLVKNLLPIRIADRLKAGEKIIAESHGEATVLFADLVGFSSLTKRLSPGHLVEILNDIFSLLDDLTERHGVEKIKTIGDAYMVVAGAGVTRNNTAAAVADFALDMIGQIKSYAEKHDLPLALRVGISTGSVISGVIGTKKLSFDIWGDTVNLASRMETNSEGGQIQVSETTFWRLHTEYDFSERRRIAVQGLGEVETYFLLSRKLAVMAEI